MVERRDEASSGRGWASKASSFRRFRRRCGRMSVGGGGKREALRGWVAVLVLATSCGRDPETSECSDAVATCCSRLSGDAILPLAEKYSLRKSFRLIGRGGTVAGLFWGSETWN